MTGHRASNDHRLGTGARLITAALVMAILALHVYAVLAAGGLRAAVTGG